LSSFIFVVLVFLFVLLLEEPLEPLSSTCLNLLEPLEEPLSSDEAPLLEVAHPLEPLEPFLGPLLEPFTPEPFEPEPFEPEPFEPEELEPFEPEELEPFEPELRALDDVPYSSLYSLPKSLIGASCSQDRHLPILTLLKKLNKPILLISFFT
jgi:hypothetical protein